MHPSLPGSRRLLAAGLVAASFLLPGNPARAEYAFGRGPVLVAAPAPWHPPCADDARPLLPFPEPEVGIVAPANAHWLDAKACRTEHEAARCLMVPATAGAGLPHVVVPDGAKDEVAVIFEF